MAIRRLRRMTRRHSGGEPALRTGPAFVGLLLPIVAALMWTLCGLAGWPIPEAHAANRDACLSTSGPEAEAVCRDALRQEPRDADVRIALSRALVQTRQFDRAVGILRDGLALEPGNGDLKDQLGKVEQLRDEQRWIEKQEQKREQTPAEGLTSRQRVEVGRMQIRCTKLKGRTALDACNQGLALAPGNLALHIGKANALMGMERYGEALETLEDAKTLAPSNTAINRNIAKAKTLRQVSVKKCLELSGSTALTACGAALQKGGPDEVGIRERQGDLLAAAGKSGEAAAAYRAALSAGGGNRSIAAKLKTLEGPADESRKPAQEAPRPAIATAAPEPKKPEPRVPVSETSKPPPVVAHAPARVAPKPEPEPKAAASAKPAKKTIVAKVEKTPPEIETGNQAPAPEPQNHPVESGLPAAAANPSPPAPVEKADATFSNAPLPSGFTH